MIHWRRSNFPGAMHKSLVAWWIGNDHHATVDGIGSPTLDGFNRYAIYSFVSSAIIFVSG